MKFNSTRGNETISGGGDYVNVIVMMAVIEIITVTAKAPVMAAVAK